MDRIAVLADIARRGISEVVNLGDHVSGPLWPRETADVLMRQKWKTIAGNHDRQVAFDKPDTHGRRSSRAAIRTFRASCTIGTAACA